MVQGPIKWLTPLITLNEFGGDVEKYMDHLFGIFEEDFITNPVQFNGRQVLFDKTDDGGRPATFVHITTEEDKATGQRNLCLRRCERIAWIRLIIENINDPEVLYWEKSQKTRNRRSTRAYLFLEKEDFLLILQPLKSGHVLVTAIYVDLPHQKRKHLRDHQSYKSTHP